MGYYVVDLSQYFCNKGISFRDLTGTANFTGMGSSYPAEQLPDSNQLVTVNGIPFFFPSKEAGIFDNVELNEQEILVPERKYSVIHILGASENGSFSVPIKLIGSIERKSVKLALTDWLLTEPRYKEQLAFRCQGIHSKTAGIIPSMACSIWQQSILLSEEGYVFHTISLFDNPSMHIFSITLEGDDSNDIN